MNIVPAGIQQVSHISADASSFVHPDPDDPTGGVGLPGVMQTIPLYPCSSSQTKIEAVLDICEDEDSSDMDLSSRNVTLSEPNTCHDCFVASVHLMNRTDRQLMDLAQAEGERSSIGTLMLSDAPAISAQASAVVPVDGSESIGAVPSVNKPVVMSAAQRIKGSQRKQAALTKEERIARKAARMAQERALMMADYSGNPSARSRNERLCLEQAFLQPDSAQACNGGLWDTAYDRLERAEETTGINKWVLLGGAKAAGTAAKIGMVAMLL